MGRHPLRRERAKPPGRHTLGSRACKTARSCPRKDVRGDEGQRKTSHKDPVEGEPKRFQAQESNCSRSGLSLRIRRGRRLLGGGKPLERQRQATGVWRESAGAEAEKGNLLRITGWSKALKGEAHARWRLKKTSKVESCFTPLKG